jgi:adenylate kinase family enzyme
MPRVVILGRGAAGKSVLAARLGELCCVPVIELDSCFWRPGMTATPPAAWADLQRRLARRPSWIMDGDLGSHDVLEVRLAAADTVIVLDFSLPRCAWRALRRSRERADFWRWLVRYRRESRPAVLRTVAEHAADADVQVLRGPRAVRRFLAIKAAECDRGKIG